MLIIIHSFNHPSDTAANPMYSL